METNSACFTTGCQVEEERDMTLLCQQQAVNKSKNSSLCEK